MIKRYALLSRRLYSDKLSLMQTLILAAITFPILLVIDILWIGVIGNGFYRSELGTMLRPDVVWPAAIAFYVIYCLALAYFVIQPGVASGSLLKLALTAAFFGFAAYATYDLTNLATLNGWSPLVTLVDLVWGTVVTVIVSSATFFIAMKFLQP